MTAGTSETVRQFWRLMATNDFQSVAEVLSPDFVVEWPQSSEVIRGPERFARMNSEYPSHGPWSFTINRLVAADQEVVTDVTVTDGVQTARAISFFTVDGGQITRLREFWPEPYDPPTNRAHLVESLAGSQRE
jgi:ketosteroid isomerase-like protein